MPQCAYHPDVETNVSCAECGKSICPRDMVATPVGYKCPDCAKPKRSQLVYVKPRQLLYATLAALAAGVGGGIALGFMPLHFFFASLILGALTAEAARRASGGHRGTTIAAVAGGAAVLGTWLGGFGLIDIGLALLGAVAYSRLNRF